VACVEAKGDGKAGAFMSLILAFQIALPVAMLVWLWRWPPQAMLVLILALAAQFSVLTAILLAGLWTLLPRWIMVPVFALWCFLAVLTLAQRRLSNIPKEVPQWSHAALALTILLLGATATIQALFGRQAPQGLSTTLAMPLSGDDLIVGNGGSNLLVNAHLDTLDRSVPRHRLWYGQSYAVDFVALNRFGITSDGFQPTNPARYRIFGRVVHAPCTGVVSGIRTSRPDLRVPQVDEKIMEGNYVSIRCGAYDVVMAHLKNGSIAVRSGDRLHTGDVIGQVGNSGYSGEPHLHIHAQTPGIKNAPFSGDPAVMRFGGRFLSRNDRI
jgi:hypothetical protein